MGSASFTYLFNLQYMIFLLYRLYTECCLCGSLWEKVSKSLKFTQFSINEIYFDLILRYTTDCLCTLLQIFKIIFSDNCKCLTGFIQNSCTYYSKLLSYMMFLFQANKKQCWPTCNRMITSTVNFSYYSKCMPILK